MNIENLLKELKEIYFSLLEKVFYRYGKMVHISNYEIRLPIRVSHWFSQNYEAINIKYLSSIIENKWAVIDLGSNVGIYTVILSKLVGDTGVVYSFEPTKTTFKLLKKTIKWNKLKNVKLENKAAGKEESEMIFYYKLESGAVSNSLISYQTNNGKSYKVNVESLDNYRERNKININFIKVDVEGSEIDVLNGASNTIKEDRPIILLAVHPLIIRQNNQNQSEIYEILQKSKYNIYKNGELVTKIDFNNTNSLFDVLCVPKESIKNNLLRS